MWFREDWILIDETHALIERDRNTLRRLMLALHGMTIRVQDGSRLVADSLELLDRLERTSGAARGEVDSAGEQTS